MTERSVFKSELFFNKNTGFGIFRCFQVTNYELVFFFRFLFSFVFGLHTWLSFLFSLLPSARFSEVRSLMLGVMLKALSSRLRARREGGSVREECRSEKQPYGDRSGADMACDFYFHRYRN